jgi:hypothetical protein
MGASPHGKRKRSFDLHTLTSGNKLESVRRIPLSLSMLNALMTDDVELFILGWRLKVRIDSIKILVSAPEGVIGQPRASTAHLTLAQGVRCVYKVQFVLHIRTLDQLAKPRTLLLRVAGKIEHDGDTLRQEGANV